MSYHPDQTVQDLNLQTRNNATERMNKTIQVQQNKTKHK